ncbi:MAG: HIT family protein [Candidatus Bathyarchaeia archaeon]|jgi:histidine triad (HIT) family protein
MSESCTFCKILRREAPASIIYEDDRVIAFLSIQPVNIGHTLVVPKKHYENIYEIPEEEHAYLYRIVKKVAYAVRKAMSAPGIRIVQNNGATAGQVIFHLHVHVIPMHTQSSFPHQPDIRDAEALERDAAMIRRFI